METGTPGHRGKECRIHQSIYYRGVFWLKGSSSMEDFPIKFCPACGVRLVPDPEPLPVPEGFWALTLGSHPATNCGKDEWIIYCDRKNGDSIRFTGPKDVIVPAWRRAFGEESK